MKKIAIISALVFIFSSSYGQHRADNVSFFYDGNLFSIKMNNLISKSNSFSNFIGNYVIIKHTELQNVCSNGTILIKFIVSKNGSIDSIAASAGADTLVTKIFKQSIKDSEKYWHVLSSTGSATLLLPVQYSYNGGCVNKNVSPSFNLSGRFDDGTNFEYLPCITLSPLVQDIGYGQQTLKVER